MKKIYVDYTHSIQQENAKAHGGGFYSKRIIKELMLIKTGFFEVPINVLWPFNYFPQDSGEKEIYYSNRVNIIIVKDSILDIDFEDRAVLFFPLIPVKQFGLFRKIKRKKNSLRIVITIHGLRMLDLSYDKCDSLYYKNKNEIIRYYIKAIFTPLKKNIYEKFLKNNIKYVDEIITDSNYSLAQIYAQTRFDKITCIYLDNIIDKNEKIICENNYKERYMLFVSGNRPEKNLARTLIAYKQYFEAEVKPINIIVTGTSKETYEALTDNLKLEDLVRNKKIVFLDYVSREELSVLYTNASFLVYASKSEGYGLPVLEAAYCGCPSIAPIGTAVPEVLGTAAKYISPYSVDSICHGMQWMTNVENLNYIKKKVDKEIINKQTNKLLLREEMLVVFLDRSI